MVVDNSDASFEPEWIGWSEDRTKGFYFEQEVTRTFDKPPKVQVYFYPEKTNPGDYDDKKELLAECVKEGSGSGN